MEAHHRHHCRACGRVLKPHRGKRHHCGRSACESVARANHRRRHRPPLTTDRSLRRLYRRP